MNAKLFYRARIKPFLPAAIHAEFADWWGKALKSNFAIRVNPLRPSFRHRWRRSRTSVEIDITYACNLRCFNCNRSCTQAPTGDRMSLGQTLYFLEESRQRQIRWKSIRLLGGEPAQHPQFLEIVDSILAYRCEFSPDTIVEVSTNGYGPLVARKLAQLPPEVKVNNSAKSSDRNPPRFTTFNVAPVDLGQYANEDFSKGCWITQSCGMGVSPYGYYPCAIAAGIDRIFGLNLGRKHLPDANDDMRQELQAFCSLCGHFKPETGEVLQGPVMSTTWQKAYDRIRREVPVLSYLPELSGSNINPSSKLTRSPHP